MYCHLTRGDWLSVKQKLHFCEHEICDSNFVDKKNYCVIDFTDYAPYLRTEQVMKYNLN